MLAGALFSIAIVTADDICSCIAVLKADPGILNKLKS